VDVYSDWVDACDSVAKGDDSTERGSTLAHRELERGPLPGKELVERYVGGQDANEIEDYDEEYAED
jgi:transcription elongation factor Elf1